MAAKVGKKRNMSQIKEQKNSPEKQLNKIKANNLSDIEFKVVVMRMQKSIINSIETRKKDQSEMKNTVSEIKTTWEGINS